MRVDYSRCVLNVQAVVVAYNRRDLLGEALAAISSQSRPLDGLHVVDNASTDGTSDMVADRYPDAVLHTLPTNTGGAGGFAAGLAFALADGADLVWLMDDDTVPSPTALEELLHAYNEFPGPRPAVVASKVVWTDGRDHPMNTPRARPGASREDFAAATAIGCIPVRSASFVSLLVASDAVRVGGLPEADFFLWNDDFEFSTRLLRDRVGLYCPASVVEHRTKTFGSTRCRPRRALLLRGAQQGVDVYPQRRPCRRPRRRSTQGRRCVAGLVPSPRPSSVACCCLAFAAGSSTVPAGLHGTAHEVMAAAGAPIPAVEPLGQTPS